MIEIASILNTLDIQIRHWNNYCDITTIVQEMLKGECRNLLLSFEDHSVSMVDAEQILRVSAKSDTQFCNLSKVLHRTEKTVDLGLSYNGSPVEEQIGTYKMSAETQRAINFKHVELTWES